MRHFLYAVTSRDPAPAGGGDAASWLKHYKLKSEDMIYIPLVDALKGISAGDMLWFAVEGELQGGVRVDSIEDDAFNNRQEIWFKGSQIRHCTRHIHLSHATGELKGNLDEEWLRLLREP